MHACYSYTIRVLDRVWSRHLPDHGNAEVALLDRLGAPKGEGLQGGRVLNATLKSPHVCQMETTQSTRNCNFRIVLANRSEENLTAQPCAANTQTAGGEVEQTIEYDGPRLRERSSST